MNAIPDDLYGPTRRLHRRWACTSPSKPEGIMISGIKILPMKPCNVCGRLAPYVIHVNGHPWGWRLCWQHIPEDAGLLLYI